MEFQHEDRCANIAPPVAQAEFRLKFASTDSVNQAIVQLSFKKGGTPQSGNGFFVNIPGAKKRFILTAAHNLLSQQEHTELKIQLYKTNVEIDIPKDNIRVSSEWTNGPEKPHAAASDYGIIFLPEQFQPPEQFQSPGDLGFSLPLSAADRFDCELFVTGYRTGSTTNDSPSTSTGSCINPIMHENQLEYDIETEAGLSGSPVWVGYKTHPTVVAIHTYGRSSQQSNHGSKGTRINLKCLFEIFSWVGINPEPKMLRACMPKSEALLEPPLRLMYSEQDLAFRIMVEEIDNPANTMLVMVFPAYAAPSRAAGVKPLFGFMQTYEKRHCWISWNPPPISTVTLVDDIRQAWLGRPHGKDWESGKSFAIVTPTQPSSLEGSNSGDRKDQMLTIDYKQMNKTALWRMKEPGEVLDLLSYQRYLPGKPVKDAYHMWILESWPQFA